MPGFCWRKWLSGWRPADCVSFLYSWREQRGRHVEADGRIMVCSALQVISLKGEPGTCMSAEFTAWLRQEEQCLVRSGLAAGRPIVAYLYGGAQGTWG
jgi:hypothetical protein